MREKRRIVNAVIGRVLEVGVEKWSVISLFAEDKSTRLNVLIGLGESRGQNPVAVHAARLLALIMGRDDKRVDTIIVVEDAEEAEFRGETRFAC